MPSRTEIYTGEEKMDKREDVNPKEGVHKYGDVSFADEKNKKYPIDTEEHIRAAWNYINKEGNAGKYSPEEVASIKRKIVSAWKAKIDKEGPPSAGKSEEDELIYFGDEVKELDGGKIGGYLIRFSTDKDPDLTADYFTRDGSSIKILKTDLPIFYAHGTDNKIKKSVIGRGTIKTDDVGVWLEAQLQTRSEYEKAVLQMAKAGKLGYSSGALSHLVEREDTGGGKHLIKTWVVGEASLTPRPAEPRNHVVPLKSLFSLPGGVADSGVESQSNSINKEINTMADTDVKDLIAAALKEHDEQVAKAAEVKAAAEKHDQEIKEAAEKATLKSLSDKGLIRQSYHSTEKKSDSDGGVEAFKSWVQTGDKNAELIEPDSKVWGTNVKTAYNVTTGASGASYLVPDPLFNQIIAKRSLMSWARQAPVQSFTTPADHLLVPRESTSMVGFTLTAEAAAYTEDEPTVTQKDLILYKYTKEVRMSEEFINYEGTNFDAWLTAAFARAEAVTENTFFTSGTGTGMPEGIKTNATKANAVATNNVVLPSEMTTLVGALGAGYNTGSAECGFLLANSSKWYLHGIQTSGFFAFIPTPAAAGPAGSNYGGEIGRTGFLGYPAFVSDNLTTVAASASSTDPSVIFANFNFFGIVEKPGLLIQRNPYLYMATGEVALFASMFRGSGVLQTEAVYYLAAHT